MRPVRRACLLMSVAAACSPFGDRAPDLPAPPAAAADPITGSPTASSSTAFVGVDVIPMNRPGILRDQTVLIRGQKIVDVGASGSIEIPAGAQRIDGRGRFLAPGLVDMHVHFSSAEQQGDFALYLANGVTTIRNMNALPVPSITAWRTEVERGERIAPTIYTTGPTVREIADSAYAERVVRTHVDGGYDAIKVYSRVAAGPYHVLMRRARSVGMPVVGHVPVQVGLEAAVHAGQQSLEHAEDLMQTHFGNQPDTTLLPQLVATLAGSGTCVTPTLVVFGYVVQHGEQFPNLDRLMSKPELRFIDEDRLAAWAPDRNTYVQRGLQQRERMPADAARWREQFVFMQRIAAALHDGGVPLLAGSDANVPFTVPGFSLHEELELLVDGAGLTPWQALASATSTPAVCMGLEHEFGTIEPGRRADLLLLEADPLADVSNLRRRVGVMARGRWLSEDSLQDRMAKRLAR